jgi:hypothetical protein
MKRVIVREAGTGAHAKTIVSYGKTLNVLKKEEQGSSQVGPITFHKYAS